MRERLDLRDYFRDGREAVAAVPASVVEVCALGVPEIGWEDGLLVVVESGLWIWPVVAFEPLETVVEHLGVQGNLLRIVAVSQCLERIWPWDFIDVRDDDHVSYKSFLLASEFRSHLVVYCVPGEALVGPGICEFGVLCF